MACANETRHTNYFLFRFKTVYYSDIAIIQGIITTMYNLLESAIQSYNTRAVGRTVSG